MGPFARDKNGERDEEDIVTRSVFHLDELVKVQPCISYVQVIL